MAVCYDTNGNEDTTQFPCSADGAPAQCCEVYQYCASNGLCVHNGTDEGLTPYSIKGCSVQDWTEGSSRWQLMSAKQTVAMGGGVGVSACGSGNSAAMAFGRYDCNNSTQVFSLGAVRIVATITGSSTITAATTTSTSTTVSDTTAAPTGDSSFSSNSSYLGVGLGVGLGIGIPLLTAAILIPLFLCRRSANKDPVEVEDSYFQVQQQLHPRGQTPYEHNLGPVSPGQSPPYTEHEAFEMAHEQVQSQPHELQ
ncbi:hypothetical protein BDW60DRAFT_203895 [Aspergillus nidulans var. acristatus]